MERPLMAVFYFFEPHNCVSPLTSNGKLHEFDAEIPISWQLNRHILTFSQ
jgi:hypothetical protein